jgi:S-adenosylmethionine hydrolase
MPRKLNPIITLTTDFGTADWFVGVMKGVIFGLNPTAQIVDLTHQIPAGDVTAGAFALMASYKFFPKRSIHVAVVDPGVGSRRRSIAVQTRDYFFVGPDNGVLSWALQRERVRRVVALENGAYFLKPVSRTFHGRDVFAPVAARLSRGLPIRKLGPKLPDFQHLKWPEPVSSSGAVLGEVLYVDRFGNALTNIDASTLETLGSRRLQVRIGRRTAFPVAGYYQAVRQGQPVAVLGSSGFLELAVNRGDAARRLGLKTGVKVRVFLGGRRSKEIRRPKPES